MDRNFRWIVGAGALITAIAAPLPRGWRFGLLSFAASELITAASQYCPLNHALGINTNPENLREAAHHAVNVAKALAT
jgi:hypothetical protein